MEQPAVPLQWVGSPCGSHGSYTFYKAFQCQLEGRARILCLGDFFPVRCQPGGHPACIAELQLLWEDRTSGQLLSSSKLYFLPEDTPQGRTSEHGQDEVIAVSEKVIVKLEDLVKWAQSDFSKWKCGLQALPVTCSELKNGQKEAFLKHRHSTLYSGLNFKDVFKEKADLGEEEEEANVIVLSYPQYCRYRAMLKRLQDSPSTLLANQFVLALGGIAEINKNTHIFYCRDTFDHPRLIENESICEKFAPNLKGRPRKKKLFSQRRDSLNGVKDPPNNCDGKAVAKVKCEAKPALLKLKSNSNTNCKKAIEESPKVTPGEECRAEEQTFLVALYKYMKERKTPIERIPYLGFKQTAQKLGGYETITARRQWKHVYDELGGNPGSTSAATCTRRHYERLILPYERFTKGEEDKPLPPVKARKQEQGSHEGEDKADASGDKPSKMDTKKSKKEKSNALKVQETSEVSLPLEGIVEEECGLSGHPAPEKVKAPLEEPPFLAPETAELVAIDKIEMPQSNCIKDIVKEEDEEEHHTPVSSESLVSNGALEPDLTDVYSQGKRDMPFAKQEQLADNYTDPGEKKLQDAPFSVYPDAPVHMQSQNCTEDDALLQLPDYIANCTVKMNPLGSDELKSPIDSNILKNALKQSTNVYVVQSLDVLKEKELPVTCNDNSSFNYTPLLYSRGNPGIMSPLAKKKLLSQVSGASLSSSYPYGSPPPLISKKRLSGRDELSTSGLHTSQGGNTEPIAVSRPSVIQHVQSFKTKYEEDRIPTNDSMKQSSLSQSDAHRCDFSKHQRNTHVDSYGLKPDTKKRPGQTSRVTNFLTDFYSSPHLHQLYKQTEHHLHSEQSAKCLSDMLLDSERVSTLTQHKHPEKTNLNYHPPLQQQEKQRPGDDSTDDQPTDLSLPKTTNQLSGKMHGVSLPHAVGQQESKPMLLKYKPDTGLTASTDGNPKACRVLPMTTSTPKKQAESNPRSGTSHSFRVDGLRRVEGTVHPMPVSKTINIGMARPLKRSLDDAPNETEKKVRIVSPLHVPKETAGRENASNQGGERSKSAHDLHSDSVLESHKYPISSPMFPGLYPGTLCTGLSSRIPAPYAHHLQYLKNQTVYSPVMQPLSLHSFMMQRQLLASSTNSQQLYRHLAAGTPGGSSYSDLLHSNIYPLASISPQNAFPSSQLSSVHPSTKL
ncbi:AT-rich interactive domain-containing protein 5B isoform X2 [Ambystoma mexicanum]|uniref:AT-rich interactive domain-containing protein 5B isoform X2 n=1 Tax=Ambystoma mexicanum TaxID=8296 RepID=UPI0037E77DEE